MTEPKNGGRETIKRCKDCEYYPNNCGYWDTKQRKKENATYVTANTQHNCSDFKNKHLWPIMPNDAPLF